MTVPREECLKLNVLVIGLVDLAKFGDVEVLLGVVELVNIVLQVPLWEVLAEPELAGLEWFVIDQREDLFLGRSVIDDFAPDCFVFIFFFS